MSKILWYYSETNNLSPLCRHLNRRVTENAEKIPFKTEKFSILFYVSPANAWLSGVYKTENEFGFDYKCPTIFLSWCRMVTRHSAFFVPVFEVDWQVFISISAKRRIWKVGIPEGWNPQKSPKFSVWRFSGTREFAKLQVLDIQRKYLKIPYNFLVSPMNAMENFVIRTAVLWTFSFTVKELQENQRFLFSSQMHTRV